MTNKHHEKSKRELHRIIKRMKKRDHRAHKRIQHRAKKYLDYLKEAD